MSHPDPGTASVETLLIELHAGRSSAAAPDSDRRRARGDSLGLLEGIPVLVKDNMDVAGWPTTAGSAALVGIRAHRDAALVTRLRRAGAVLLGKTAMHELAAGITAPPLSAALPARLTRSIIRRADQAAGPRLQSRPAT